MSRCSPPPMKSQPKPSIAATPLRRHAEARLREHAGKNQPGGGTGGSTADTRRLLHELQVHQIELEMQNEELQKSRRELQASLEQYSELYDFAPVGYLTLDREGAIREANLMAADLLGSPRAQLAKQHLKVFVAPADRSFFDAFFQQVFESRDRTECEVKLIVQDKPPVDVRMKANLFDSELACRVTVSDITQQKQAEEDRLVIRKLESTGILAGGIAHDFNNLLTVILGNLELASMLPRASEELVALLAEAQKAGLMAHDLTQQLITFADGGGPVRKPTRLSGLIQDSVRLALRNSRLSCEFSLLDDLSLVEVDHGQIGQVIRNMVLNAREAMSEGGVISVRMENVVLESPNELNLPSGKYVRIGMTDQGGGIAPDVLPRIFDPYFSTKKRGEQKGMGLGLTICHAVIQKHGGAIAVNPRTGGGTTFHLYLPTFVQEPGDKPSPGSAKFLPGTGRQPANHSAR